MIRKVKVTNFKRFKEIEFDIHGHIVLAGPNNMGKTTLLQAIEAWRYAFERWKELNDFQRHGGQYPRAPITRQSFYAVPLLNFDMLWNDREYDEEMKIQITNTDNLAVTMIFIPDSTEQIYVRPHWDVEPHGLRSLDLKTVYVPPMTGLSTEEPVYTRPKLDQLLGQGKPGDIIRNLLVEAHSSGSWDDLRSSIRKLFGFELQPPNDKGADIIAEYQMKKDGPRYDIASAGSGFQQVLMLLTFLHTRPASILLLDEPDAHLHIILQDVIYSELRLVAAKKNSQLLIATHSEVIINSVEPHELGVLFDKFRLLSTIAERVKLTEALGILSHIDIMLAMQAPGILYVENYTDLDILRAWAKVLNHPAYTTLTTNLFWKPLVYESRPRAEGVRSRDHFEALQLVKPDIKGLEIVDGDARADITEITVSGSGLQRIRWKRYEIESYLVHPTSLARYVDTKAGSGTSGEPHLDNLENYLKDNLPPALVKDPLGDHSFINNTKARTEIIPPALSAAGLPGADYTHFYEIAEMMKPEEIHPEVIEKLDAIQRAFGL